MSQKVQGFDTEYEVLHRSAGRIVGYTSDGWADRYSSTGEYRDGIEVFELRARIKDGVRGISADCA